jgi:hypothetical protein
MADIRHREVHGGYSTTEDPGSRAGRYNQGKRIPGKLPETYPGKCMGVNGLFLRFFRTGSADDPGLLVTVTVSAASELFHPSPFHRQTWLPSNSRLRRDYLDMMYTLKPGADSCVLWSDRVIHSHFLSVVTYLNPWFSAYNL